MHRADTFLSFSVIFPAKFFLIFCDFAPNTIAAGHHLVTHDSAAFLEYRIFWLGALLARLGQSSLDAGRVGGGAAMREPWRAVRQRRLGRKDGEAFGTAVYSAAQRSASKDDKINVPVPLSCVVTGSTGTRRPVSTAG